MPVGGRPVRVVDADLSTVTSVPDKLVRVGAGRRGFAAHVEFQTARDRDLDERVLAYNVLARRRHGVPVRSVVFLLRRAAGPPGVTGSVRWPAATGSQLSFDYQLIRTWELPVGRVLAGGLGTLPLAPIAAVTRAEVPAVVRAMRDRLDREVDPPVAADLWTATDILMGLRYSLPVIRVLLQGVQAMRESASYQRILSEGRDEGRVEGRVEGVVKGVVQGERNGLIRAGTRKFGSPNPTVLARIAAVDDADELDRLIGRVFDVSGWDELLDL